MRNASHWWIRAVPALVGIALATGLGHAGESRHVFRGVTAQSTAVDFTLTAHTGDRVRLTDFRGKLVLLYFGYTFCPGICPATLAEIREALNELGSQRASEVQVVMITVDPERDTPERLAAYLAHFDGSFLGMTGTPDEIVAVSARYGIYVRKEEGTPTTGYMVDHTSMVIVVDQHGYVRLLFPFGTAVKDIVADLAYLLREVADESGH